MWQPGQQRVIDGAHLVNAGSVGRPKAGDARACCVLLDFALDRGLAIEFVPVDYDAERAAAGIIALIR